MKVQFHADFPQDILHFAENYRMISNTLTERFRQEVDSAIETVKPSATGAEHRLEVKSTIVPDLNRRNLKVFPFFILYGIVGQQIIFDSVIPSRSDPLTWQARFNS